jgi:hypothetical protein
VYCQKYEKAVVNNLTNNECQGGTWFLTEIQVYLKLNHWAWSKYKLQWLSFYTLVVAIQYTDLTPSVAQSAFILLSNNEKIFRKTHYVLIPIFAMVMRCVILEVTTSFLISLTSVCPGKGYKPVVDDFICTGS